LARSRQHQRRLLLVAAAVPEVDVAEVLDVVDVVELKATTSVFSRNRLGSIKTLVTRNAYGGPPGILVGWHLGGGGNQRFFDDFLRQVYRQTLVAQGHPLGDNEGRTLAFFNDMLNHAVLPIANGPFVVDRAVRIDIDQQADPAQRDPRIHITGKPGIAIRHHNVLRCVVELKKYQATDGLFNVGRRQAMLYAAAIGFQHRWRMVAIVTDLARWQFIHVTA
jgi:hypothetical protein